MRFLRRVCGYVLTDHVHNTKIRNVLQIYALEEGIQNYKTSGIITSSELTPQD
jgi:hypothetical protein